MMINFKDKYNEFKAIMALVLMPGGEGGSKKHVMKQNSFVVNLQNIENKDSTDSSPKVILNP